MEFFYEKVYATCENKHFLIDIYSVGKKHTNKLNVKKNAIALNF